MKDIDETPPPKSESEQLFEHVSDAVDTLNAQVYEQLDKLNERIEKLETEVADLHHSRDVSRAQEVNQDPEWYA